MTFCLGVRCVDGVVLAADSLWVWVTHRTDGSATYSIDPRQQKIVQIGDRMAFVPSGSFLSKFDHVGRDADEEWTFDEVARGVFDELAEAVNPLPLPGLAGAPDGVDLRGAYDVVVAGMDGDEPALSRRRTIDGRDIARAPIGQLVTGGGLSYWHLAQLDDWDPLDGIDVASARNVITAMCWAYVNEVYLRCGSYAKLADWPRFSGDPEGGFPLFAFPLDVLTITAAGSTIERVEEPDQTESERLLASIGPGLRQVPVTRTKPQPGAARPVADRLQPSSAVLAP